MEVPRARQAGFTLIELLVVVALIGLLLALLLPAVQSSREAARRVTCQNNLRQIGLALGNHAEQLRAYPVGCIGGPMSPDKRSLSWNAQLLPFLEQTTLYDRLDLTLPSFDPKNLPAGYVKVETFLCPSTHDQRDRSSGGLWKQCTFTDYGGIYGVEGAGRDAAPPGDGAGPRQTLRDDSLGIMLYEVPTVMEAVTDGLSKTAIVAEIGLRRQTPAEWINGRNIFAQEQSTPINGSGLGNEIGSPHAGGAVLVWADGHVAFLSEETSLEVLTAFLTRAAGD